MKVEVPSHWTKQDINGFLRFLKPNAEDKQEREGLLVERPEHHCWLNGGCAFWFQTGEKKHRGYCSLGSCTCITATFNYRNPTRWLARKETS